jgi:hypothetical protein
MLCTWPQLLLSLHLLVTLIEAQRWTRQSEVRCLELMLEVLKGGLLLGLETLHPTG